MMKALGFRFPNGSHGKFPVGVKVSLGAVFAKACARRELDPNNYELFRGSERVDDLEQMAAGLAGETLEIRPKSGLKMKAEKLMGKRASHQLLLPPAKAAVESDTRHCRFCGTTLYEQDLVQTFGNLKWHDGCFKCSKCFSLLEAGSKVYHSEQDETSPVCETCYVAIKGEKNCLRCGESIRGCFVIPVESLKGDMHVECLTCNLCNDTLVGGYVEKDGELLCLKHRSLRPVPRTGPFRRPVKSGKWHVAELCLIRIDEKVWARGSIKAIHGERTADVEVDGKIFRTELADLRVTHMPLALARDVQKDHLRRGKLVEGVTAVQRQNSLAVGYIRVKPRPKPRPSSPPPTSAKVDLEEKTSRKDKSNTAVAAEEETEMVPPSTSLLPKLRYHDGEEVIALFDGEWCPAEIVTGDPDVANGPWYLVLLLGELEELVHESEIRRVPFYRVGQKVEACYSEDSKWYAATVDEVLNNNTYLVTFDEYGNTQQCTEDWLRPAPGTGCQMCGGPQEILDGACYFCGGLEPKEPSFSDGASQTPLDNPSATALLRSEIDRLQQRVAILELENEQLRREKAADSNDPPMDLTMSAAISLGEEMDELRERLNESELRAAKAEAELEALKKANSRARLRESHTAREKTRPLPTRAERPLPQIPPGLSRQKSLAVPGAAGRGSRRTHALNK